MSTSDASFQNLVAKHISCDRLIVRRKLTASTLNGLPVGSSSTSSTSPNVTSSVTIGLGSTPNSIFDLTQDETAEKSLTQSGTYIISPLSQTFTLPPLTNNSVYDIRLQPSILFNEPPRNPSVRKIQKHGDYIYIGGSIDSHHNGTPTYGIIRFHADTLFPDYTWIPQIVEDNNATINDFAFYGDDTMIICGEFQSPDLSRLAKISLTTAVVTPLPFLNDTVNSVCVVGDFLFVGGYFTLAGDLSVNLIAKISLLSGEAVPWNVTFDNGSFINQIVSYGEDTLFFTGGFNRIEGINVDYFASVPVTPIDDVSEQIWKPIGLLITDSTSEMLIHQNYLYIWGYITDLVGVNRHLIRFTLSEDHDPLLDDEWDPLGGEDTYVRCIEPHPTEPSLFIGLSNDDIGAGNQKRRNISLAKISIADGSFDETTPPQRYERTNHLTYGTNGLIVVSSRVLPNYGISQYYDKVIVKTSNGQNMYPVLYKTDQLTLSNDFYIYRFLGVNGYWQVSTILTTDPFTMIDIRQPTTNNYE
jgi:hypothetical protein